MKAKSALKTAAVIGGLVLLALIAALLWKDIRIRQIRDARWRYAAGEILCVGDSLTSGACFGQELGGADIRQRYAWYLGRMLNARVDVDAIPGASVSDWYRRRAEDCSFRDYDTVIIWFGTNNGPEGDLASEVLAFDRPEDYADTEMGWYCRLIERIRAENPDCLILLVNVFASKNEVEAVNRGIAAIAAHYGLPVADMSDMGSQTHPEYHAGLQNPHFGKAGNIAAASRIVDTLEAYFAENPARCEYGVRILG